MLDSRLGSVEIMRVVYQDCFAKGKRRENLDSNVIQMSNAQRGSALPDLNDKEFATLCNGINSGDLMAVKLLIDKPGVDWSCCDVQVLRAVLLSVIHCRLKVQETLQ